MFTPSKMEIKFANDALVFTSLRGAIKRALSSHQVIPELSPWHRPKSSSASKGQIEWPTHPSNLNHQQIVTPPESMPLWPEEHTETILPANSGLPQETAPEVNKDAEQAQTGPSEAPFQRTNIWQIHNKYIISQIKNGLIVIDQHVAHERILYERALKSFEMRKPSSQQLLFPQILEFASQDYALLLEMIPFLENIGFVIKAFGKNTIVIEGVPSDVKIADDEQILLDILDEYKRGKRDRSEIRENVAASFACHSAIRAGDPLSLEAMNALIDQLFSTEEPYFCPHGRPVIVHISLDELDKRFKRH